MQNQTRTPSGGGEGGGGGGTPAAATRHRSSNDWKSGSEGYLRAATITWLASGTRRMQPTTSAAQLTGTLSALPQLD